MCGNWGLLGPRDSFVEIGKRPTREVLPRLAVNLLLAILDIVELRGAQAGGCNVLVDNGAGGIGAIRARAVKSKRGHLGTTVFAKFSKELSRFQCSRRMTLKSVWRPRPVVLAQGHSRFGTSSSPAEIETHPHRWLGSHMATVWRRDTSQIWYDRREEVCVTVTHNGDFDGWIPYDQMLSNDELGEWLTRIFGLRNESRGDSAKWAGTLDLLLCQGQWFASVRLAYVQVVLTNALEVSQWQPLTRDSPTSFISSQVLEYFAHIFEQTFRENVSHARDYDLDMHMNLFAADVSKRIRGLIDGRTTGVSEGVQLNVAELKANGVLDTFCTQVCTVFLRNDLMSSVVEFFEHAEGTFGVSATSTVYPQRVVLAAKGQPMSAAFDLKRGLSIWASEPGSLTVLWPEHDNLRWSATARLDLQDATGEAIELSCDLGQGASREESVEDILEELNGQSSMCLSQFIPLPGVDILGPKDSPYNLSIRGVTLDEQQKKLTPQGLASRWVGCNPPLALRTKKMDATDVFSDAVAKDISCIPDVISEIDSAWHDRSSLNFKSGHEFARCLNHLVQIRGQNCGNDIDVLIYGIENSLWLGQQFAADLQRLFPRIKVTAMSSNWVLGLLQKSEGHIMPMNFPLCKQTFRLAPDAITLGISQSGTTYPSVWATRLLRTHDVPLKMFAMSAHYDTVLANSLGQDLRQREFNCRLFSTMSDTRPAEPSTVASVAMHHTLTKLLSDSAGFVRKHATDPDSAVLPSCGLSAKSCAQFSDYTSGLPAAMEDIVTGTGTHKALLRMGDRLAHQLLEPVIVTVLSAIYVYITVTMGVPFVSGIWARFRGLPGIQEQESLVIALDYITRHIDAWVYVFLAALLATGYRWLTGRRLWTRYTARCVVITDCTVNYKLLRAYISKLRALAFRFTSFGVMGQNLQDHFVHEMTHLATSDVILVTGRPDGRLATLAAAESAAMMALQQARFIASRANQGLEIMSIGHNPWEPKGLFCGSAVLPSKRVVFASALALETSEGGHPPSEVRSRAKALFEKEHDVTEHTVRAGRELIVSLKDIQSEMGGKEQITRAEAGALLVTLMRKQEERLGISVPVVLQLQLVPLREWFDMDDGEEDTVHAKRRMTVRRTQLTRTSRCISGQLRKPANANVLQLPLPARFCINGGIVDMTASDIMSMVRGRALKVLLLQLRASAEAAQVLERTRVSTLDCYADDNVELQRQRQIFEIWQQVVEENRGKRRRNPSRFPQGDVLTRSSRRQSRTSHCIALPASQGKSKTIFEELPWHRQETIFEELPWAEWRIGEDMRRVRSRWASQDQRQLLLVIVQAWMRRANIRESRHVRNAGDASTNEPVGDRLVALADVGAVDELRLLESLYENRVAALERLVAFYVVFHRAVRPLATFWPLSYSIDRTESRLRVSSTPAPVPFVEVLAECGAQSPNRAFAQVVDRNCVETIRESTLLARI